MFGRKHKNLQPWLDYFKVLQKYQESGYLEVRPKEHEAYITRAALYTLAWGEDTNLYDNSLPASVKRLQDIAKVVRHIRTYCGWRQQDGYEYLLKPFALHVVKEEHPHDLVYTLHLSRRHVWWKLWMWHDKFEFIPYE